MKPKGKGKEVAAVKSKKKSAGKTGATLTRHDIVFELPLRVRAASREEATLLGLQWLTDALLQTCRPATIRVSPPHKAGITETSPLQNSVADASPIPVETVEPPPAETATQETPPLPEASDDTSPADPAPAPRRRRSRAASAAANNGAA